VNPLTDLGARLVIGHRGNAAHAPENTIESFDQAAALGVDALEFDVRITRDGVPVVIHDPTLARTAGRAGVVAEMTTAELERVDVGATFTSDGGSTYPFRGRGLTIARLDDVLKRFPELPLLIEVKVPGALEAVERALIGGDAMHRSVIASMTHDAVAPFRGRALATGASGADVVRLLWETLWAEASHRLPYDALCIPRWYRGIRLPVTRLARVARRGGAVTHVWTIDDPGVAKRLWSAGIQGIVTNDPAVMLRARNELQTDVADSHPSAGV
jgi:glycerophosphoryl diester phosphodiesterase